MNYEGTLAELEEFAAADERPAFTWEVAPGEGHPCSSKIGGSPCLAPSEPWPTCGICEGSLNLYVQVDLSQVSAESGLLQLFLCDGGPSVPRMAGLLEGPALGVDPGSAREWRELLDRVPREELEKIWRSMVGLPGAISRKECERIIKKHFAGSLRWSWLLGLRCAYLADYDRPACALARIVDPAADAAVRPQPERGDGFVEQKPPRASRILAFTEVRDRPGTRDIADWEYGPWSETLTEDEMSVVRAWNLYGDKLGGWPSWHTMASAWPECPECGRGSTMSELVLQLTSNSQLVWLASGLLVVARCPHHPRRLATVLQNSG
jgi:hypothetical protein